jgi:hypothetical protein
MANLTFVRTLTPKQFGAQFNVEKIDIIVNPKTSKTFFSAGALSGAVTDNYKEDPMFSEVHGEDGELFWMLHKKNTSDNVVATMTL